MEIDLAGKVAYVTGGNKGIGWACAQTFARCGADVAICGRDGELSEARAAELEQLGVNALGLGCDVAKPDEVKQAFQQIQKKFGQLDILVNNAGVMHTNLLAFSTPQSIAELCDINVNGALYNLQMAAKLMARKQRGCIVNVSSIVGRFGAAGQIAYSGSKAAIIGITQAAAKELASQNIRVNAVAPGFIDTDLLQDFDADKKAAVIDSINMQRIGSADEVANVVLFLSSELASYVTGQVIGIDGGMVL
jgi:3-oxoacyl-[acyl-carrier protein] reductase